MRLLMMLGLLVAGKPFYKCYGWFPRGTEELCISQGGVCHKYYEQCAEGSVSQSNKCAMFLDKCCINLVSRYGDINDVNTTGASMATAGSDKLSYHGVRASHKMAETDLQMMNRHKGYIMSASREWVIQPSIIAGIISRETRAGNSQLDMNGYGHDGGFGLMQISGSHTPRGGPNSYQHISQGTGILVNMINSVSARHPTWTKEMKLKGGISAYNAGPGNVRTYENMDVGTTHDDYANDVVARAQWFKMHGYE